MLFLTYKSFVSVPLSTDHFLLASINVYENFSKNAILGDTIFL